MMYSLKKSLTLLIWPMSSLDSEGRDRRALVFGMPEKIPRRGKGYSPTNSPPSTKAMARGQCPTILEVEGGGKEERDVGG